MTMETICRNPARVSGKISRAAIAIHMLRLRAKLRPVGIHIQCDPALCICLQ